MKRFNLAIMMGLAVLPAVVVAALIGPDRGGRRPDVRKTNCAAPHGGQFEHLTKCADWRKG